MMTKELNYSQAFIDKHRDINVGHDWWDYIYDDFNEQMQEVGVAVDTSNSNGRPQYDIYFSGLWSQGDGACFEGMIDDWPLFFEKHFKPDEFKMIRKCAEVYGWPTASWRHSGHCYHSNSLRYESETYDYDIWFDRLDEFLQHCVEAWGGEIEYTIECNDLEECVQDIIKGYCDDLYKSLEEEYNYQTSDKAVIETLRANEMEEVGDGVEVE